MGIEPFLQVLLNAAILTADGEAEEVAAPDHHPFDYGLAAIGVSGLSRQEDDLQITPRNSCYSQAFRLTPCHSREGGNPGFFGRAKLLLARGCGFPRKRE